MKTPGPDHPITTARNPNKIRVTLGGQVTAESTRALTMKESTYPSVDYIPREDVHMELLERSKHSSHCPYKGEAAYYSIDAAGRKAATRSGPMRSPIRRFPRSSHCWPSIPIASTPSRSCPLADPENSSVPEFLADAQLRGLGQQGMSQRDVAEAEAAVPE